MASRKIEDCHPLLQPKLKAFIATCKSVGIDVLITCTWRSGAEQDALYAQGRTTPGRRVTNARAGQSKHNFMLDNKPASKAFDCVALRNGKPVWDAKDTVWLRMGAIGKQLGLQWAGDWKTFKEFPHFQLPL